MMSNPQHLIHTIQQAFSGVTLGNGIGLSEGNAMDDYAPAEERARCRKQDEQTHWHKIPVELLNQYYVALCYFDPEGMRFHLPAFLIADLQGQFRFDLVSTFRRVQRATILIAKRSAKTSSRSIPALDMHRPQFSYHCRRYHRH